MQINQMTNNRFGPHLTVVNFAPSKLKQTEGYFIKQGLDGNVRLI